MKTPTIPAAFSLLRALRAATVAGLALAVLAPLARAQAVVDPDPEIFDGTKTKREAIKQQAEKAQTAVDDWEGDMVIYDTNGQAPQGDGQGEGGDGTGPGTGSQQGMPGGIPGGLPVPLGGGAGGTEADPSLQIPTGQQTAEQAAQQAAAQQAAQQGGAGGAQQNADISGAAQSANRPSDVSIGDPSQRIKTNAQGQAGNTAGKPEGGEQGAKEAGEDATQGVPSGGSQPQSGTRGGGVEKGDTMPPDQI